MSLLTLEDFKDRLIDPNWSPLEMLLEVAEVGALKYNQEHNNSAPCIPKTKIKPNVVSKIRFLGPKKTETVDTEISKQPKKPISLGYEFVDSDVEVALGKCVIKNEKLPTISETESYLEENDQVVMGSRRSKPRHTILPDDEHWVREKSFKKVKMSSKSSVCPNQPPDLPQEIKNKIVEMCGGDITLVIQKPLFSTDVSPQHNRLSMPSKQIKNVDFLHERELQVLQQKQTLEVPLIQPSLEITNITLAKWDMPKSSGSTSSSYVLRSSWMKVVAANQLTQNDTVQIWSFRVQEKLCLALIKVIVS